MEKKLVYQVIRQALSPRTWPHNLAIKLLSFFFALFLWYFVVGADKVDMKIVVPVEILNVPSGLVIANQFKSQLEVTVSGPRSIIRGLENQRFSRAVDLSKAMPGTIVINNQPADIPLPRGIDILRIQPSHVNLLIDILIDRTIPIKPLIVGEPAHGYKITVVSLEPETIVISGPKTILADLDHLTTEPIDVDKLTGNFVKQVKLALVQTLIDLIGEPVVMAKVYIQEKTEVKVLRSIHIEAINTNDQKFRLIPEKVEIKVEAPVSLTKDMDKLESMFQTTVSLAGLSNGLHVLPIDVVGPKNTKIMSVTPDIISVEIFSENTDKHPGKKLEK